MTTLLTSVTYCWPLLFGMFVIMLGNGLQGSLISLRAILEGFSPAVTGLIMSGYFAGFIAGSKIAPILIGRVGHVRVFAALASIVSISALLHPLFINVTAWILMRLLTGFGFAGLFIVAESWLNDRINNETRGQLLSIYMLVTLGGFGSGPLLLNIASPTGFELFILISVLFSFSLVPILLTAGPVPPFKSPKKIDLITLYKNAPLSVVGCLVVGISNGTIIGIGVVYAEQIGLTLTEISLFMSIAVLGGMAFQWPLGYLSDKFDRRLILTGITITAAGVALFSLMAGKVSFWILLFLIGTFGGLSFSMYSIILAYANDRLRPDQMVGASGSLVMTAGFGAMLGPVTAGSAISFFGPSGFFGTLVIIHLALGIYAVYRILQAPSIPVKEQGPPVYLDGSSQVAAAVAFEEEADSKVKNHFSDHQN